MSRIKLYVPIDNCVNIKNPQVVPLLLHMRWFGQSPSSDVQLEVGHPVSEKRREFMTWTKFHRILWDDLDESPNAPYRKARLRLEGKELNKDIFALLEVNAADGYNGTIIFSNFPFGPGGIRLPPPYLWILKKLVDLIPKEERTWRERLYGEYYTETGRDDLTEKDIHLFLEDLKVAGFLDWTDRGYHPISDLLVSKKLFELPNI